MNPDPLKLPRRARGSVLFGPAMFLGFLAAIAVPAYQDYTMRVRVTEGLNLASALKAAVAEFYATSGNWPRDLRALGLDAAPRGTYVTFAAINHGTIVIRYSAAAGAALARGQVTLRPTLSGQNVVWSCGYGPDQGMDPTTGAASPHVTTVTPRYLPPVCRGN